MAEKSPFPSYIPIPKGVSVGTNITGYFWLNLVITQCTMIYVKTQNLKFQFRIWCC